MLKKYTFNGYNTDTDLSDLDEEITFVDKGSPCGELLRRYWHPVLLSEELGELPKLIKVSDVFNIATVILEPVFTKFKSIFSWLNICKVIKISKTISINFIIKYFISFHINIKIIFIFFRNDIIIF